MTLRMLSCVLLVFAACSRAPAAPAAPAEPPVAQPAEPAAPTAESIIEAYIEATGGRAAREQITALRAFGTMRIAKLGIGGKVEMITRTPNLAVVTVDIDGLGRNQNGSDGTTVWEKAAMTGARVLEGAERERSLRKFMLHADMQWRTLYTKVELVGPVTFEGKEAWKVQFTTPLGDVETSYYDQATTLALGSEEIAKTQMGEMPTRTVYLEWGEHGGLKMPTKILESTAGLEIEVTLDKVELNPSLAADAFAVPPDVIPLIKK
jgi:hypothetical protein